MKNIIIPVSGGKDSQACVALAVDQYGAENCLGIHQHTGFDHKLTYEHMDYMRDRYQLEIRDIKSTKYSTVPELMVGEGIMPTRHARACTKLLKIVPWFKWLKDQPNKDTILVLMGMRAAEGVHRRKNYGHRIDAETYEMGDVSSECPKSCKLVKVQLPIVQWSPPGVFEFLKKRGG